MVDAIQINMLNSWLLIQDNSFIWGIGSGYNWGGGEVRGRERGRKFEEKCCAKALQKNKEKIF